MKLSKLNVEAVRETGASRITGLSNEAMKAVVGGGNVYFSAGIAYMPPPNVIYMPPNRSAY